MLFFIIHLNHERCKNVYSFLALLNHVELLYYQLLNGKRHHSLCDLQVSGSYLCQKQWPGNDLKVEGAV